MDIDEVVKTPENKTKISSSKTSDIHDENDLTLFEDFEFQPDYDEINFFMDDLIQEQEIDGLKKKNEMPHKISQKTSIEKELLLNEDITYSSNRKSGKSRIKKINMTTEELEERKEVRKKRRSQNPEILAVTYVFSALFVLLIGYFAYFNVFVSEDVINSPYNVRIQAFAETIIRGDIVSNDGTILAETLIDENGEEVRYYPCGRIFSHVVGTSQINQSGIELSQNFYMLQSNENPLKNAMNDIQGEKNQGDRVVTTLDVALQEAAYNALGNNDGAVVAIEPSTGKILAMVSKPDYNPNTLLSDYEYIISGESNQSLLNKSTLGLFAPGSIFKSMTALSYIRSNNDVNQYSYYCEGQIDLSDSDYITCFNHTVHGNEDLYDSFANSCNASFGNIGLQIGREDLTATCDTLLFNTDLPTELSHKASQFVLDTDATDWEIAATSIGQGKTLVTPLHMAMITSAIANGGNLMEPYLIDSIETADSGRRVKKNLPESYGQILTTSEAAELGRLMEAVTQYGTASSLSGYGYSVAGKTGTAEVAGKGDNSWFVGYAPAEQPRIAICVLVENDQGYYESALPVANAIFQDYLNR